MESTIKRVDLGRASCVVAIKTVSLLLESSGPYFRKTRHLVAAVSYCTHICLFMVY